VNRQTVAVLVTGAALAASLAPSARASADSTARNLSTSTIAEDPSWRDEILDDPSPIAEPVDAWAQGDSSAVAPVDGILGGAEPSCVSPGGQLVADFGRETGGAVEVDVTSAEANTNLRLGYAEARAFLTPTGDFAPEAYNAGRDDPVVRTDTFQATRSSTWRSSGTRGGQRYVMFTVEPTLPGGTAGTVCVDGLRVIGNHLRPSPDDYTGHFLSSEDDLNAIWYAGTHTYHLAAVPGCCGQLVITDGAKRDRQIWTGDTAAAGPTGAVSTAAGLRAWKDTLAALTCYTYPGGHITAAAAPTSTCQGKPFPLGVPGPDYPVYAAFPVISAYEALYIVSTYDYWRRTGDTAFVLTQLPVLQGIVTWMQAHIRDGLYHPTPNEWRWTAQFADGADTFTNAVWTGALRRLGEMERAINGDDDPTARSRDTLAESITDAMLTQLWDAEAGAFRATTTRPVIAQDGNAAAVLYGVIDGDAATSAIRYLDEHWRTTPFGTIGGDVDYVATFISGLQVRARMQIGDAAGALEQIRATWRPQVHGDPGGTVWENVKVTPTSATLASGSHSAAHAWASQPTSVMSDHVLGIQAAAPGFARWTIAPQVGDLSWAQGAVPTPTGAVTSRWRRDDREDTFVLSVDAPAGTTGTVVVPTLGSSRKIWRDGALVWNGRSPLGGVAAREVPGGIAFDDVAGTHTFAWAH
jgi:hypothetical protein